MSSSIFDIDSCEMLPAGGLDDSEWSAARRTIWDVDLNDTMFADNDLGHLRNQRRYQRYLLIEGLNSIDDAVQKIGLARASHPTGPAIPFLHLLVPCEHLPRSRRTARGRVTTLVCVTKTLAAGSCCSSRR